MSTASAPAPSPRLASLDQFRGYTVAGMFLVNFLSGLLAAPFVCHHHNTYCSYADTIMPQFFFAVGFSMRLSFGRRVLQQGAGAAYFHMIKRLIGLVLVAIFLTYHAEPHWKEHSQKTWAELQEMGWWGAFWPYAIKNTWFQTLTHIAVTSLWILPVIRLSGVWRVLYLVLSAGLHLFLSWKFNFLWVNGVTAEPGGIDGGPLGFLSWSIPTLAGTLACDMALDQTSSNIGKVLRLLSWGALLMAIGYGASCLTRIYDVPYHKVSDKPGQFAENPVLPSKDQFQTWFNHLKQKEWSKALAESPLVPPPHSSVETVDPKKKIHEPFEDRSFEVRGWNYWMMSQRAGSISYLTFAAGLSLAIYGLFYLLADMIGIRIGVFRTFGVNALIGYILHDMVGDAVKAYLPKDSPVIAIWIACGIFFLITWLFMRGLEKQKIYIKL
jgi:predicted acyltransferase